MLLNKLFRQEVKKATKFIVASIEGLSFHKRINSLYKICKMKKTIFLGFLMLAISASSFAQKKTDDDNIVYTKVEKEAEFANGLGGWRKYLERNLNASVPNNNGAPAGTYTVIIKFIVSKNGKVSDVQAETKHGYGMEGEAISTIKKSPDWKPAIQNGKPVNAYRRQPITYLVPKAGNAEFKVKENSSTTVIGETRVLNNSSFAVIGETKVEDNSSTTVIGETKVLNNSSYTIIGETKVKNNSSTTVIGETKILNDSSSIIVKENKDFDKISTSIASQEEDVIFTKVEQEAKFPGGLENWRDFLSSNLSTKEAKANGAKPGIYTVIIQFIVNLDGTISNVTPLTKFGYGMEKLAADAVQKGPNWIPAMQNGKAVRAYRMQPITFVVK